MKNIMFVCTGNICRSAMAEFLLKKLAQENNKQLEICSCGTYATDGDMPTYEAISVLKEDYNIDMTKHRATNVIKSNINNANLILCATNNHKLFILQMFPKLREKTYTIKEYAGESKENIDIADPWGCDIDVYRKCAKEIYELEKKIIDKL